jgi:hypothetical protein
VATEAELLRWRRHEGRRIIEKNGRYWTSLRPGFFQPLHPLSRLSAAEAIPPARLIWGFRAALGPEDADQANGSIPVHLIPDLEAWDEHSLSRRKREQLRQALRSIPVVQLTDSRLLEEQGYAVYSSFAQRVGASPAGEGLYLRNCRNWSADRRSLILAGLRDGRLVGYLEAIAAENTLYIQQVHINSDASRTNLAAALYYYTLMAYKRTGQVKEAVGGLYTLENPNLSEFKRRMGFVVTAVPAKFSLRSLPATYLRRRQPFVYYRLTGILPGKEACGPPGGNAGEQAACGTSEA